MSTAKRTRGRRAGAGACFDAELQRHAHRWLPRCGAGGGGATGGERGESERVCRQLCQSVSRAGVGRGSALPEGSGRGLCDADDAVSRLLGDARRRVDGEVRQDSRWRHHDCSAARDGRRRRQHRVRTDAADKKTAASFLQERFEVPAKRIGLPIGVQESDVFFAAMEELTGQQDAGEIPARSADGWWTPTWTGTSICSASGRLCLATKTWWWGCVISRRDRGGAGAVRLGRQERRAGAQHCGSYQPSARSRLRCATEWTS